MKTKTDPKTKPYYRCLVCPNFRVKCGGRPTRGMDLKNWCEYIRDIMDAFHLTVASVAEKADVSQKRIEKIRSVDESQDIMRVTARKIELAVIGPATDHICDMDFDTTAAEKIATLQEELAATKKDRDRLANIIDKFLG